MNTLVKQNIKQINEEEYQVIKDLCEGQSTTTKVANRIWGLIAAISIYVLIAKGEENGEIKLFLDLGSVDISKFYSISFVILGILTISYLANHCQVIHSALSIESAMLKFSDNDSKTNLTYTYKQIKVRMIRDTLIAPTWHKVSPLTKDTEFKRIFWSSIEIRISIYLLLKILTLIVFYTWPLFVLFTLYEKLEYFNFSNPIFEEYPKLSEYCFLIISFIVAISFISAVSLDVFHIKRIIWNMSENNEIRIFNSIIILFSILLIYAAWLI